MPIAERPRAGCAFGSINGQIKPGDSIPARIEEGLEKSVVRCCARRRMHSVRNGRHGSFPAAAKDPVCWGPDVFVLEATLKPIRADPSVTLSCGLERSTTRCRLYGRPQNDYMACLCRASRIDTYFRISCSISHSCRAFRSRFARPACVRDHPLLPPNSSQTRPQPTPSTPQLFTTGACSHPDQPRPEHFRLAPTHR